YPLVFIRGWLLGTAKRTGALRARTHRRRNRNARRSSRFLFFAFRSLSFSLRFLLFGQRPKFHNLCLHRTIRHFVIRASHFLVGHYLFHRRRLATFRDDGFLRNLEHTRILFAGDGERFRFIIDRRNHALESRSPHFPARRSRHISTGSSRTLSIRRRRAFCFGITPRRQADRHNPEERADD